MPEPTIDEMLAWLSRVQHPVGEPQPNMLEAIRAILEQHREFDRIKREALQDFRVFNLEAIRAFIERVEKRLPDYNTGKGADSWLKAYRLAVMDELAALEKETQ